MNVKCEAHDTARGHRENRDICSISRRRLPLTETARGNGRTTSFNPSPPTTTSDPTTGRQAATDVVRACRRHQLALI